MKKALLQEQVFSKTSTVKLGSERPPVCIIENAMANNHEGRLSLAIYYKTIRTIFDSVPSANLFTAMM